MTESIYIARAFNGPPDVAHGGYFAGIMSKYLNGTVEVTIRRPPPLERPLVVEQEAVRLVARDGATVIAEAEETKFDIDVPSAVGFDEATRASASYLGFEESIFPDCLACGPARKEGEGLRIFTGPVPDRDLVAGPWEPGDWVADQEGMVRPEFVWAALDCPGAWALHGGTVGPPLILGRLAVRLIRPVASGHRYVVMAWPIKREGRKGFAGSAVLSATGEMCAVAHATWIRVDSYPG